MKKTIVSILSRKFVPSILIASALMAFAPLTGNATSNTPIEVVSNNNTTSVQFAGSAVNGLMFDVKINNLNGDKFKLVVRNGEGEVLFSKDYADKSFSKKIKILKDDSYGSTFSFNIVSDNKALETTYQVNATTKVVDDVIITKL
ncbi:hypothetical protein [Limnovirga soli]|uniref:NEAT domain-containing protein n=1 Tax=Limnovirga soli TaxID=2656915 RepID=A0A8J8JU86_9BACT|nr:hypothetical protein [Limnovirga soli]NNV56045.1 hypothetical protein [Limnovirga soli]